MVFGFVFGSFFDFIHFAVLRFVAPHEWRLGANETVENTHTRLTGASGGLLSGNLFSIKLVVDRLEWNRSWAMPG